MKEIILGTIGSGPIVHWMMDNVMITDGIRLAAVYSRSEQTGSALALRYGVSKIYTDLDAFLSDDEINFVYVASPNLLHYEQTKKALLAGKNVICEKPFCTQAAQARELVALAKERGLFLVDSVPPSYLPNFDIALRELPKLGRIRLVMANYSQYSSRYDKFLAGEKPNVFNPEFAGGCLMDINFYNLYLNVAFFGKPQDAVYYPNIRQGIDTSGVLVLRYPDFVSQAAGAKDTWGENFFQIEGEQGYLYIKDGPTGFTEVKVVTKQGETVFNEQPNPDRWFYEVQKLTKLLLDDDFDEIYRRLDIMVDVIETLETARKKAGILFPGDSELKRGIHHDKKRTWH